ncbi:MAG: gluconokinase [Rubrivivax sp.]|nr:gluconokinase [Rubrivivax sp.]
MAAWRIVVMGVSGCGKSTVGRALAEALGARFVEGDELHPPQNVARMAAGVPLTDADRAGWLDDIGRVLAEAGAPGAAGGVVVSCSALKRAYRDRLRAAAPGVLFAHLHGPRELLQARLAQRRGHYMPASLLQSQFEALQPPADDEGALAADIALAPQAIVTSLLAQLGVAPAPTEATPPVPDVQP